VPLLKRLFTPALKNSRFVLYGASLHFPLLGILAGKRASVCVPPVCRYDGRRVGLLQEDGRQL